MAVRYSPGIVITDKRREGRNLGAIPTAAKRQEFINTTKACLDALKRLATGARLLAAIDASGHEVEIYRTWDITGGNAQGGSDDDEMVHPLNAVFGDRSEEHTSELQSLAYLVCRLLLEKKK